MDVMNVPKENLGSTMQLSTFVFFGVIIAVSVIGAVLAEYFASKNRKTYDESANEPDVRRKPPGKSWKDY